MPKHQGKAAKLDLDLTPTSLHLLKRAQLQQHCKKLGLRGVGKNTELIQRLQEHFKQAGSGGQKSPRTPPPPPPSPPGAQDGTREEQAAGGKGWCVIHGQELTIDRWYPLSLRCGRACVTRCGLYVPLHLVPSSIPTPPGLTDNLICGECMERNREKDDRIQQKSALQDKSCPSTGLNKSGATGASRSRNKSGRFQPQEDPEYARRVDELLNQMASGKVDSQKVLQPIRPAVFHSPLGKQEQSPVPINA
ncbi:uncharacterized protein LOC130284016 [Hyla sarda]|uniref:uncharacterized protein LOC130284016 n=1 Tax=Hyla sarda TaxID=327740 RepID=UPI0024C423D1|nr:uncharacterized protein LOC130284016 [Hyla sarda]XP_056389871.1 uncharacterized protein LOC130284016 [Hyla sarda]